MNGGKLKLMLVVGARPNFIKIAPLVKAIKQHQRSDHKDSCRLDYVLVHTGQHYDIEMSESFFLDLNIPKPDINMEIGSFSHSVQTAKIMIEFEKVCLEKKPDWVIVVGDVNSTMAASLVAAKLGIRIAHVEAGLRSFDRTMPEEVNRLVTDALADLLFTPSKDADRNLLREGVPPGKIRLVGNIMIDTLVENLEKARQRKACERFGLAPGNYVYVTLHRPSNVDRRDSLSLIMENLGNLSQKIPVIFPIHPRTRKNLQEFSLSSGENRSASMILSEPVGYHDSIGLAEKARFVLTDSGGLQEETTFLNTPCLTLRPNTERPITILQGTNKLTSLEKLAEDMGQVMNGGKKISRAPELWDGHTGERIVEILAGLKN